MNPTFHLYGMKITLAGDLTAARDRAHLARLLMFKTKLVNVNNLDIIQNNLRLNDGTHVHFMSQHGFDSATIYVPPKPAAPKPRKRRWVEQFIWPAIEAYTEYIVGVPWGGQEFVGLVLCKGGGFDGPYEFIPKDMMHEDFPLEDLSDESAGPQPKVRNWVGITTQQNMVERLFEDLEPLGISELESLRMSEQPVSTISGDINISTEGKIYPDAKESEDPDCACIALGYLDVYATRDVDYQRVYAHSFDLDGDPEPGNWSPVSYQCFDQVFAKPYRQLNLAQKQRQWVEETGWAQHYVCDYTYGYDLVGGCAPCDEKLDLVLMQAEDWCGPPGSFDSTEDWYGSLVNTYGGAGSFPCNGWCDYECMLPVTYFSCEGDYWYSSYDYYRRQFIDGFLYTFGSILSESEYALLYSKLNTVYTSHYFGDASTGVSEREEYYELEEYGPAYYAIDGTIMEIPQHDPGRPRVTWGDGCKYFQVGALSVGLFYFQFYGDGTFDRDYMYGYAEVNRESGESDSVTTYFSTKARDQIFEMTDFDGNPVYNFNTGKNRFRLIRETVTYEEDL